MSKPTADHPTIAAALDILAAKDPARIPEILAEDVVFLPPTYWAEWRGRQAVALVLSHVMQVFSDFRYRRVMGAGRDWALEFQCKVGEFDAVGVDLLTLDDEGRIARFEVVMRPLKTVAALREAMNARVAQDPRFAGLKPA
ncbi:nuclear transport factor 2 family protein [Oceanicella actignis]|uniref:SnoaL-like domain-containing protein n=1 Tax=Oceanicella actignis TaxID=1189325 RepID=A0A1M7T9E2_9RHOB|nr:nuclear transport factor 2 family protein [Oceanicella actignis]SET51085.1 SnoaL-like domain-containing protein [Oceanicella actignis]SHN67380.1 SnoaL-like domain-containing protein [Oceanicella actignis]